MKYLYLIITVICLTALHAVGQKQHNIWHFGRYASLNFNSGVPVATQNSKLNSQEGCTSVSDDKGQLLFYSDGVTIWNKRHLPMPNGSGLLGHESTSQSVIAIPKPGSPEIYFIFTLDQGWQNPSHNGLRYSVLDLTLDGGLGDITSTKNVLLETPLTEKLTAVLHRNGYHYWVLVHRLGSDAFAAYLLTENGVSANPVVSHEGQIHYNSSYNMMGCLRVSQSGTKLALAGNTNVFELFDFNNFTGLVSNGRNSGTTFSLTYGVEFSPDETKLYGSTRNNEIYQFDLTQPAVFSTGVKIGTFELGSAGATLQLGPDNKIYKARSYAKFLGVINDPDMPGTACNYVNDGVSLGNFFHQSGLPYVSMLGLPSQPAGGYGVNTFNFSYSCKSQLTFFSIPNIKPGHQVSWNFGDLGSGVNNLASGPEPAHVFSSPGKYQVTLTLTYNGYTRDIIRELEILPGPDASLGKDTVLCEGERLILQKPWLPGVKYLWNGERTENYLIITRPGTYKLQVEKDGCTASDSIAVSFKPCSVSSLFSVPNIITPNKDGINDKFKIFGPGGAELQVQLFNRWGTRIYESKNYKNDWEASGNASGIYFYLITENKTGKSVKGWLEVVK